MNGRHLAAQFAVLALGLLALNVAGHFLLRHDPSRLLIHAVEATSPPVDDLLVGNSLMAAAADPAVYQEAASGRRAFNLALGGSSPMEHDLLLRHAARLRARRVFYGFYDLQVTDAVPAGFPDLFGNRALDYYLDRETAIRVLVPDDPWRAWRIRLVSHLPLVVDRQTLWARVERLRRSLGGIGLGPAAANNRFGRVADFAGLEAAHEEEFARDCQRAADARTPFNRPVTDMLATARAAGTRFVFIEMPMTSTHRRRFYSTPGWLAYTTHLRALAQAAGADFLDASDWLGDDRFSDALHANAQGAAEFSRRLGEAQTAFPATPTP